MLRKKEGREEEEEEEEVAEEEGEEEEQEVGLLDKGLPPEPLSSLGPPPAQEASHTLPYGRLLQPR